MRVTVSAIRIAVGALMTALVAAGCGAAATPAPVGPLEFHLQVTPSHVSAAIAIDQGFFTKVKPTYTLVGYGESSQLFHAGTDPIGNESAWESAVYQSQGKDIRYFSTAEANDMASGVIIRTEDAAKYKTLTDLKGKTVGIPGFGTGTWAAFQVVAKGLFNIQAKTDLQIVEGDPGSLEGLLQTKKVEAMITFQAPTAHALANPAYKMIFGISEEWNKTKGIRLPINGWIADSAFLDKNVEAMKDFNDGLDKGLAYLKAHPEVNKKGAKYEGFASGEGVLVSPETTAEADRQIKAGTWYYTSAAFTQKWVDSMYEFVKLGEGILLTDDTKTTNVDESKAPPKDKVFYLPLIK